MKIRVIYDAQKSSRECIEFGNTMLNHKWLNRKQYLLILSLNSLTKILIPHALSFQERLLVFKFSFRWDHVVITLLLKYTGHLQSTKEA